MAFSVFTISNLFVEIAKSRGESFGKTHVQKFIYFANGIFLSKNDEPLISEKFQAWRYDPVVPELYSKTKNMNNGIKTIPCDDEIIKDKEQLKKFLESIYGMFINHKAKELSYFTHRPGGAWGKTPELEDISDHDIKEEFNKLLKGKHNMNKELIKDILLKYKESLKLKIELYMQSTVDFSKEKERCKKIIEDIDFVLQDL